MFVKSRSDWYGLDWPGAEFYRYCYAMLYCNEWRKRHLACVRVVGYHFKQFYYSQLKNVQLDELSAKVSEM